MSARHGFRWHWCAPVAYGVALLWGCEGGDGSGTSRYFEERHEAKFCPGAFTPNSTVCYDKTEMPEGPISTDNSLSEGLLDDVDGVDRCLQISVPVPGTPGALTVSFTTTELKGTYEPRNVGAAWIEDSMAQYVRTVEVWAGERVQSITMWFPRACHRDDKTQTRPDVITSATLLKHAAHSRTWDGKDFRGAVAPDGQYTLWLQVTESEFVPEGPYMMIPFEKGNQPWERMVTPIPGFADIRLKYTPGSAMYTGSVKP
jgi:hypothetical protein